MMNKKSIDIFKENVDDIWRNVYAYAQCLLIAYDRISREGNFVQQERLDFVDYTEIEELRYFISLYNDKSYDQALLDRKIRFILNKMDQEVISDIITDYKESFLSKNSSSDNFF